MALEQGRRRNWFNDAKEVDFLKELNKLGAWQVINNILKLLSTQDLCRICEVCKTWKEICRSDKTAWRKRTEFLKVSKLKIIKLGKENVGLKSKNPTPGSASSGRAILSPLDINITPVSETNSPDCENPLAVGKTLHPCRPCPQCHSPAVEVSPRRAKCTSPHCTFDFCRGCFKPWHDDKSCHIQVTSPGRHKHNKQQYRKYDVIGSKQNKKRLKRL